MTTTTRTEQVEIDLALLRDRIADCDVRLRRLRVCSDRYFELREVENALLTAVENLESEQEDKWKR